MQLLSAKCKKCRRVGVKLFLKGERCFSPKCAMVKRDYAPGAHGSGRKHRSKLSKYGEELMEKQKTKLIYGLSEHQLKNYYKKAKSQAIAKKESLPLTLIRLLETRLDNVIFKCGFAPSRKQARQLVGHKHIMVNNKIVNSSVYQVMPGNKVQIKLSSITKLYFKNLPDILKNFKFPAWINFNKQDFICQISRLPEESEIDSSLDMSKIIEFYSR